MKTVGSGGLRFPLPAEPISCLISDKKNEIGSPFRITASEIMTEGSPAR